MTDTRKEPWWLTTDFDFIRIPKELFRNPYYGDLSTESKLLYGFLLDRASLSWVSGEKWRTETGDPFVIFTIEEIRQRLHCSKPKAIALLRNLEEQRLIQRTRPLKDGPYHIVVRPFYNDGKKLDLPKSKDITWASAENLPGQVKKSDRNNTENNKTDINYLDRITLLEGEIKKKIEYDILLSSYPKDKLDSVVTIMAQTLTTSAKTITLSGIPMEAEVVKQQLRNVGPGKVQYLFDNLEEYNQPIRSYRSFYLARLCDPDGVVDAYYTHQHRRDSEMLGYVNPEEDGTASTPYGFSPEFLQNFTSAAQPDSWDGFQ